ARKRGRSAAREFVRIGLASPAAGNRSPLRPCSGPSTLTARRDLGEDLESCLVLGSACPFDSQASPFAVAAFLACEHHREVSAGLGGTGNANGIAILPRFRLQAQLSQSSLGGTR